MSRLFILCVVSIMCLTVTAPVRAQETSNTANEGLYSVKLGVGAFDVGDDDNSANFRAELHTNDIWWIFHPFVGVDVNTDGGIWGGAGVAADIDLTNKIAVTPSLAAGLYGEGNSKDLGGALEFRTGVEAAYKMDNGDRVGLELTHMSNAEIYDDNPGAQTVSVNYHVPVSF